MSSCATCARSCAAPGGAFEGGRCCGTSTLEVFTQTEVRALKLTGVSPPRSPPAGWTPGTGCAFRGPQGCDLPHAHRPAKCLIYVCAELRDELARAQRLPPIQAKRRALERALDALSPAD